MGEVAGVTRSPAVADANGALAEFDAFYERERASLIRVVAFATSDPSAAAEAVDEAMARAFQRWASIGRYADPAGWVYRVALNVARSRWRRARRLVLGATPSPAVTGSGPEPVDEALWSAVGTLPQGQRDAVVLRFVLDWDFARIAGALDIEPSSARARVSRAVATLRDQLEVSS